MTQARKASLEISLAAQELRYEFPMQGAQVGSLVTELDPHTTTRDPAG